MRAKLTTLLLVLVLSIAMATLGNAANTDTGTLGHVDPGDHGKPGDHGNPGDHGKPDDHRKDHGKGTVVVTVHRPNGQPASEASVTLDGQYMGRTNPQGMLTLRNMSPGEHQLSVNENSRHSSLRGSTQIRVRAGQAVQTSIRLRRWR